MICVFLRFTMTNLSTNWDILQLFWSSRGDTCEVLGTGEKSQHQKAQFPLHLISLLFRRNNLDSFVSDGMSSSLSCKITKWLLCIFVSDFPFFFLKDRFKVTHHITHKTDVCRCTSGTAGELRASVASQVCEVANIASLISQTSDKISSHIGLCP